MKIRTCRVCGNPLKQVISFGRMPMVNYYLSKEELKIPERKYSLTLCMCEKCTLAQLNELVSPKNIFIQYHYASSVSQPLKTHLENLAELSKKRFSLTKNSHVIDIGCNDGVLLAQLQSHEINVLGIDPAKNIVSKLKQMHIPVIADFFTEKVAQKIATKEKMDAIFATNTLAQVVDLDDFIKGIKLLLSKHGVFIAEVGYLVDMIQKKTFDSIYHEHYSYFSLQSLMYLFGKHHLQIFDAQRIANHGGSLRIFVQHVAYTRRKPTQRFLKILDEERKLQLHTLSSYDEFVQFCKSFKKTFRALLLKIKKSRKTIVGVTAPAKGVIVLNYCGIDTKIIDYIVDSTPYKQYRFMPGVHIPIYPEDTLQEKSVDYFLLLAWTYKQALLKKLEGYRKQGTKLILPLPKVTIIS